MTSYFTQFVKKTLLYTSVFLVILFTMFPNFIYSQRIDTISVNHDTGLLILSHTNFFKNNVSFLVNLGIITNVSGGVLSISNGVLTLSTNGWTFGSPNAVTNAIGPDLTVSNNTIYFSTNNWVFGTPNALTNVNGGILTISNSTVYLTTNSIAFLTNGLATISLVNTKFNSGGGTISGNTTIVGDLNVVGNTYQTTVINITTNVNMGITTNYVNQTIYSTNISYTTYITTTNQTITNTVDTYVNNGGNFTLGQNATLLATNANIYLPTLTITNNYNTTTGTWDWTGATWVNPPTNNWTFGTPGALTNETDPVWSADKPSYATTAQLADKADSNKTVSVVINGATNTLTVGLGGLIDLGTLATVTGSVENAQSLGGIPAAGYVQTNHTGTVTATAFVGNGSGLTNVNAATIGGVALAGLVQTNAALDRLRLNDGGGLTNLPSSGSTGMRVMLTPGGALTFGSVSNALIVGTAAATGYGINTDTLQFDPTTPQLAPWQLPVIAYTGGAVNVSLTWREPAGGAATNVWEFWTAQAVSNAALPTAWVVSGILTQQVNQTATNLTVWTGTITPSWTNNYPAPAFFGLFRNSTNTSDNAASASSVYGVTLWQ